MSTIPPTFEQSLRTEKILRINESCQEYLNPLVRGRPHYKEREAQEEQKDILVYRFNIFISETYAETEPAHLDMGQLKHLVCYMDMTQTKWRQLFETILDRIILTTRPENST